MDTGIHLDEQRAGVAAGQIRYALILHDLISSKVDEQSPSACRKPGSATKQ